jgi:cholesterol oxidase
MSRIASPIDQIAQHYEVLVIGSGYGGGIAASRMARAGRRVGLLERGKEILAGDYPNTLVKAAEQFQLHEPNGHIGSRTGLFDFHVNAQQNVLVGCGLGGTSLINANVSLEAKPYVFDDTRWPLAIREHRDTLLKDGYARARDMLKPNPYPEKNVALTKMAAHQQSANKMGQAKEFYRTPINVNFETLPNNKNHVGVEQLPCNNCGDCVSGCNNKAKNTTLMNYLPDAWNHGAEIFCQTAVSHIEKASDGWLVHYQYVGTGREKFDAPTQFVKADIVIVSAGTLGSTEIMLRSQQKGLALSDQLGHHFSGNGDILGFGFNTTQKINGIGFGDNKPADRVPVGPCITSVIDMRDQAKYAHRMVIEEGSIPGAIGKLMLPMLSATAGLIGDNDAPSFMDRMKQKVRAWTSLWRGPYYGAIQNTQTYLIMSHDDSEGRMLLDAKNQLRIDWPGVGTAENVEVGNARLNAATKALEGIYAPNPIWSDLFKHAIVSVHPLGGCVMGEDAAQAVVNHKGQAFSGKSGSAVHENLYVTDGSVIPTSLAVNPLLTISAISERAMQLLAQDRGWYIDYSLPSAPKRQVAEDKLGIQFTETMTGYFSTAFTAAASTNLPLYEDAYQRGKADDSTMSFTITVDSDDLEKLISDPKHPATMAGTLTAPALSSKPMTVTHGEFNLFEIYPEQVGVRHMNYNMRAIAEDGSNFYFSAFKSVPSDHSPFKIWHDTSTLYVTVYRGSDKRGAVLGSGVLHIQLSDFVKQMTTMKVSNAKSEQERIAAIARFGKYFAGVLWENYAGILAGKHDEQH